MLSSEREQMIPRSAHQSPIKAGGGDVRSQFSLRELLFGSDSKQTCVNDMAMKDSHSRNRGIKSPISQQKEMKSLTLGDMVKKSLLAV